MNEQHGLILVEGVEGEIYAALQYFWRLGLKIIVNRIPKYFDPMRLCQCGVIKFDLHVDDVSYAGSCHLRHTIRRPDSPTDRDPVGHPSHIHPENPLQLVCLCGAGALARRLDLLVFELSKKFFFSPTRGFHSKPSSSETVAAVS